jgi:ArsR family metal-binding transcriptional regulator
MIPKNQIFQESESESESKNEDSGNIGLAENTPLKRAKQMYEQCIKKAKMKHSSSTSRSSALDRSDMSWATPSYLGLPPSASGSVPESECMKVQVDLLSRKADL